MIRVIHAVIRFEPDQPVGIPEGFLEVSARLGAQNVLVMSAEPDEARTMERFCDLCDRAASYGLSTRIIFHGHVSDPGGSHSSFVATMRMIGARRSRFETTAYRWARLGYLALTTGMLLGFPWAIIAW